MSKKQKKQKDLVPKRPPTRRQLDKWERQRRWQLIATCASAAVIAAVLILVGAGLYREEIAPRRQPVMVIGDKVIDLGYLTNVLTLYTRANPGQASSMLGLVVQDIQKNELMVRGAEALGIRI
ncbi:MAG: hypothetical protein N3E40_03040, partial [Dehalococcoidia bacterium]|nr:hypothetical protein [Dehalococcoidia bacterium]